MKFKKRSETEVDIPSWVCAIIAIVAIGGLIFILLKLWPLIPMIIEFFK